MHLHTCYGGAVAWEITSIKPELDISIITHTENNKTSLTKLECQSMRERLYWEHSLTTSSLIQTFTDFVRDCISGAIKSVGCVNDPAAARSI